MLCPGLRNQDIPHRTKIRSHVMKTWDLHVRDLKRKMRVSHLYNVKFCYLIICTLGSTREDFIYG